MINPDVARLMGDTPHLSLDELVSHPRLGQARDVFLTKFLAVYGDNKLVTRTLIESGRYLIFAVAIVLYAAQDPARPESWATVGRVKKAMLDFGLASERQIDGLISRLRDVGFLEIVQSEQDGRVRILRPTERAMAHDRDWLQAHFAPLIFLYPERDYSGILSRDRAFQVQYRRSGMEFLGIAVSLLALMPEVMVFLNRMGGYMFLAALMQASSESPDSTFAAVSYADVGERFGYSRTHVRQVLTDAEAAGLVRLHTRGGHKVEILPVLWAGHDKAIAIGMYLDDMLYAKAAERVPVAG